MNKEKERIEQMFDSIAGRYDFLNHFLSAGIDRGWRRRLVREVTHRKPLRILDVATGTGDVAILMAKKNPYAMIDGIDLSAEMLKIAKEKIGKANLSEQIRLSKQDASETGFETDYFDVVTAAFGVRNFENLEKGLAEMYRIVRPEGTVMVLEFSMPTHPFVLGLYRFYFSRILPLIGKSISKDRKAYRYLFESVAGFPQGKEMQEIFRRAGFTTATSIPLSLGICSLYLAQK